MQPGTDLSPAERSVVAAGGSPCSLHCSRSSGFEVEFAPGLSGRLALLADVSRALVVMSPTVDRLYGSLIRQTLHDRGIELSVCTVPMGERRKNIRTLTRICTAAERAQLGRRDVLIAVGGGVCSDLVSLAASMYRRGIDHLRIPTTLIGQVDAGIGIKGGINFRSHKNLLGCFHPPRAVLIDTTLLRTLEAQHIRQGMAEILKMALIADRRLFDALERHGTLLVESRFQAPQALGRWVVRRSIGLMLEQLQQNPYENVPWQRLVDMGHTFSPALEAASGFRLSHGEAVAVDMALTCMIADTLGLLRRSDATRFVATLCQLGIPAFSSLLTVELCQAAVHSAIAHRGGKLHLVVPTSIGAAQFVESEAVPAPVLRAALSRLRQVLADLDAARSPRALGQSMRELRNASPAL
jgi:2-epi-5-epi-valiolone synthase